MPSFSIRSKDNLSTCDKRLQKLFNEVIRHWDCTILQGHRGEFSQNKAFLEGRSKLRYPKSKHNQNPSKAVDVAPYPIDWDDLQRFYMFVGFVRGIAIKMGIKIRVGADWDGDGQWKDQNFHDLPHFEIDE